jgi:hypothetical protein
MPEIIYAFLWAEGWDEGADPVPKATDGSLGGFAQKGFELGKGHSS